MLAFALAPCDVEKSTVRLARSKPVLVEQVARIAKFFARHGAAEAEIRLGARIPERAIRLMELIQEFERVIDVPSSAGIEHAVCGGIALAIHGHPRATRDIDLLLRHGDLAAGLEAVRRVGYTLEGGLLVFGADTARERRLFRVSRASGTDLMTLDLLLVVDANDPIWTTREAVRWRGRDLVVVSRAGLIAMKQSAGRLQDLADIERLERGEEPQAR